MNFCIQVIRIILSMVVGQPSCEVFLSCRIGGSEDITQALWSLIFEVLSRNLSVDFTSLISFGWLSNRPLC